MNTTERTEVRDLSDRVDAVAREMEALTRQIDAMTRGVERIKQMKRARP